MAKIPQKLVVLSEEDAELLRRDHAATKGRIINRRVVPKEIDVPQAPDVYIAKVTGGIPARMGDTPGSATCDIYKIDWGTGQLVSAAFSQEVWNLATSPISEGYVTIQRDKYGRWLAGTSSQGEQETWVEYTVTSEFAPYTPPGGSATRVANAVVNAAWGKSPPTVGSVCYVFDDQDLYDDVVVGCKGLGITHPTVVDGDTNLKIIRLQRIAFLCWAQIGTSPITPTDTDIQAMITGHEFIPIGESSFLPAPADVVFINEMGHCGKPDDDVILRRVQRFSDPGQPNDGKWIFEIVDVTHHEVRVVQERRVFDKSVSESTYDYWIQTRGVKGSIELFEEEEEWVDELPLFHVDSITSIIDDGVNFSFISTPTFILAVMPDNDAEVWSEGTDCEETV